MFESNNMKLKKDKYHFFASGYKDENTKKNCRGDYLGK